MANESQSFELDFLREELQSLDRLETWGASLFLGAIALVAKQLIDWVQASATISSFQLHAPIFALPALIGLFAFIYLRVVNFRIRRIRNRLYSLTKSGARTGFSFGVLGWLMSLMPLLLGYAASWYFTLSTPHIASIYCILLLLGAIVFFAFSLIFILFSQQSNEAL